MKETLIILLLIASTGLAIGQSNMSIEECLKLEGFNFNEFRQADRLPKDTIVDLKNGYYEINDGETKLLQASKYNNPDGSILIVATGFYADMQCENYFTKFFQKRKDENKLHELSQEEVLPKLLFSDFFMDESIKEVTEKYQTKVQENYIADASVEDIYTEFFDIHFILPQYGTKMKVTLTTCDYIPRNVVSIEERDWNIIESRHKPLTLIYDKKSMVFVRVKE